MYTYANLYVTICWGDIMPLSEARKRANKKFLDTQDDIKVRVPAGLRERIKEFATLQKSETHPKGESMNEFIVKAINERLDRLDAQFQLFPSLNK
jgi:predicted HicB family RNase H-like nuclease